MYGSMVDIQYATTENREGKEKKKKADRRNHTMKI